MKNYLKEAVEAVTIYKTPKEILKFIQMDVIIKNPPYEPKTKIN